MVNIAKIKGTHNAMKSGMLAAESAFEACTGEEGEAADLTSYDTAFHKSWVRDDLYEVRNLRPSFNTALGLWGGIAYSGIDSLLLKGRVPWTFKHSSETPEAGFLSCGADVADTFNRRRLQAWIPCTLTRPQATNLSNTHRLRRRFRPISSPASL